MARALRRRFFCELKCWCTPQAPGRGGQHSIYPNWDKIQLLVKAGNITWLRHTRNGKDPNMPQSTKPGRSKSGLREQQPSTSAPLPFELRLQEIISDLDGAQHPVAAAYAQMALDMLKAPPTIKA